MSRASDLSEPGPGGTEASGDADRRTAALREHLVDSRLAGPVATSPANTLAKCEQLVEGDADATFGLPVWRDATVAEAADAVRSVCGADPRRASDPHGPGWIDPDAAVAAIARHAQRLSAAARAGAAVLLATGHPTGLLAHYAALARALQAHGCPLLTPLDGVTFGRGRDGSRREVRYLDGVASLSDGASLLHTHRDDAMRAMLTVLGDAGERPTLVLADHGFAGAAIAAGLATLSIADVNDVALPLAQVRGWTDAVLPIDDNLPPRVLTPVTGWILEQISLGSGR